MHILYNVLSASATHEEFTINESDLSSSFSSFGPAHVRNIRHPQPEDTCSFLALFCLSACLFRMSVPWDGAEGMGSQHRLS